MTVLLKANKKKLKEFCAGVLFALPVILGVIIFTYYPAIQAFIYAFTDYDGFYQMNFVGLYQFEVLFTLDPDTWTVFSNTFIYAFISVPLNLLLGYVLALVANYKVKGISFFRTVFYLPVVIPSVASSILFMDILDAGSYGIINRILTVFGLPAGTFFSQAYSSMPTLIFMNTWMIGGSMIIWLAAFKNIPGGLYEAASLEGANAFQRVIYITIPLSTSMIFYNLVTGIIGSLQITSTLIIGGTEGKGVGDSLYFVAIKIYNEAFRGAYNMGYASAIALVLFVIIALFTALIFKTSKWVYYEE